MTGKPSVDEIIKYVTSSDLEKLEAPSLGETPVVAYFPLCSKWRKNITLLYLAVAHGSLTCIQHFMSKVDVNSQTDGDVSRLAMAFPLSRLDASCVRCSESASQRG